MNSDTTNTDPYAPLDRALAWFDRNGTAAAILLVVAFGLGMTLMGWALDNDPNIQRNFQDAPVAEDDPGWDCETMGNGVCGPVTITYTDGGYAVVTGAEGEPIAVVPPDRIDG